MSSDWDSVTIIRKKQPNSKVNSSDSALNAARRAGQGISVEKKFNAGSNKNAKVDTNAAKLDQADDVVEVKNVGLAVSKAIQQARMEKKWTQKDLAVKVNEKQNVINEYESGKAIPNQQVLSKLERVLGVKLRGSNIGDKLGPKK
ncbi:MBF1-domain-containing protein [Rozella allomycis CSF55]|uniref:MBF1-domain-containing protein n=1 Tax=Rozella allomycis (strain CSF55) TaxID=988480 RepID=A0A4P9YIM5_ROZAC|nr:MBF1-domain-containing protein [Rozella allomycis CSF55]